MTIGVGYSLTLKPQAKIIINDTTYNSAPIYQKAANDSLRAIKNRTKLTVDERGIKESLVRQFPEIDTVELDLALFSQTPTLRLQVAKPVFNLSSGSNLYVVGSNGNVTALSRALPGSDKLPTVTDQTGYVAEPGKPVLASSAISFINSLLAQLEKANVPISTLVLPPLPQELHLRAADTTYYVKFYLGGDVLIQAGQYLAARNKLASDNQQNLQYVDVRVAGKIYYK
ncbi:hypothetical protein HYW36_02235 [Candidatus Saccharibacteria bacterium]|nr:hypothetical protein [Candidatus Saccharibacteria bacterium]